MAAPVFAVPAFGTAAGFDGSFVNNKMTNAAVTTAVMSCTTRTSRCSGVSVSAIARSSEAREAGVVEEPECARQPQRDEHREHEPADDGQRPAGDARGAHAQHLDREHAVERAAEQRVHEAAGLIHVRLEAERPEAVVRNGK